MNNLSPIIYHYFHGKWQISHLLLMESSENGFETRKVNKTNKMMPKHIILCLFLSLPQCFLSKTGADSSSNTK